MRRILRHLIGVGALCLMGALIYAAVVLREGECSLLSAPEAAALVRDLVGRWAQRTGQPVPVPKIVWPKGDVFAAPTLESDATP